MSNKTTNIIAFLLLGIMAVLTISSVAGDSLTMDELAHLPAGYSYLTQKDMRLNPEHPPLIKDLAAVPLLLIKGIKFPSDIRAWKDDINSQWDFGANFLYKSGNPTDKMIFWGRMPMILLLLFLGFYLFKATRELFGDKAGLISLFLFALSPTFLAHGRLVTTDVGAAAGAFISTYYFIRALKIPTTKNIIISGIVLGIAELCKFSLILLAPFFIILALVWWLTKSGNFIQTLKTLVFSALIGIVVIWPVYLFHTWNYPAQRQHNDTVAILASYNVKPIANAIIWLSDKPILRPYAEYLFGLAMVSQRTTGGNTSFFLGNVSSHAWKSYFPVVYAIKETIPLHLLTIIALICAVVALRKANAAINREQIKEWLKKYFIVIAAFIFAAIYWTISLYSNLNIGVRHLLPFFPFLFMLVGAGLAKLWLKPPLLKFKYAILGILAVWQIVSVTAAYPGFLSYFNEIIGGSASGINYVGDSNLDWGQDLKRLKQWTDKNLPAGRQVYIDYFGGGSSEYYFGNRFIQWHNDNDPDQIPKNSYLAVSATFLQIERGKPAPNFNQQLGKYDWLCKYKPLAIIGRSIYVFRID